MAPFSPACLLRLPLIEWEVGALVEGKLCREHKAEERKKEREREKES